MYMSENFREIVRSNPTLENIIYFPRKVQRPLILSFPVVEFLHSIEYCKLNTFEIAILVKAVATIWTKKKKFTLDDCNKILKLIRGKIMSKKAIPPKIANNYNCFVDVVQDAEIVDTMNKSVTRDMHSNGQAFDSFQINSIEITRNDSFQLKDTIVPSENSFQEKIKKMKIVEDKRIEIDMNKVYRKTEQTNLLAFKPSIFVPSEVEDFLSKAIDENIRKIEMIRNSSSMVANNNSIQFFSNDEIPSDPSICAEKALHLHDYGKTFVFDEIVSEYSEDVRAFTFYSLLVEITNGTLQAVQESVFSPITIHAVK